GKRRRLSVRDEVEEMSEGWGRGQRRGGVGGACAVGIDEEELDGRGVFVEDCEVGVEDRGGYDIEKGLVGEDEDFRFDMLNEFVGVGKAEGDRDLWKLSGCGAEAGKEDRWGTPEGLSAKINIVAVGDESVKG
ncbi:hypothetical protein CYMTET_46064, partial [Cymbomonas tetramitiformis]